MIAPIYRQPPHLARVMVCAQSGDLPNADCPRTVETWYIPGRSPIRVSSVHRRLWIDEATGRQACPPFERARVHSEVFEFWPSDVMQLFAQAGIPRRMPPPPADCAGASEDGQAPRITSPLTASTYTLRAARAGNETIPLAATTDGDVRTLHWFVDDAYVGTAQPGVRRAVGRRSDPEPSWSERLTIAGARTVVHYGLQWCARNWPQKRTGEHRKRNTEKGRTGVKRRIALERLTRSAILGWCSVHDPQPAWFLLTCQPLLLCFSVRFCGHCRRSPGLFNLAIASRNLCAVLAQQFAQHGAMAVAFVCAIAAHREVCLV